MENYMCKEKVYMQFQEVHKYPPMYLKTLKDEQDISRYNPNPQGILSLSLLVSRLHNYTLLPVL